jgi:hypothetical protein
MYDFIKARVYDEPQVMAIMELPFLNFLVKCEEKTGALIQYPKEAKWGVWTFIVKSPTWLEIRGSIHKHWHKGSNYKDFDFGAAQQAIKAFCEQIHLEPALAHICNLEYGINVKPEVQASEIIREVICLSNRLPMRPYEERPDRFFIEVQVGEYYVKVYDKGKQYGQGNILRFEIKAMKSRTLAFAKISTMADLLNLESYLLLGRKINQVAANLVFNDRTIKPGTLKRFEHANYMRMKDPNEWVRDRGKKTSSHRNRERQFKRIVEANGTRKLYSYFPQLVNDKVKELLPSGGSFSSLFILGKSTNEFSKHVSIRRPVDKKGFQGGCFRKGHPPGLNFSVSPSVGAPRFLY